ncbi:MAG: TonB-dependent receptor plug [Ferruginibacter sp.]|nr:TonB-dependent receptor plug [Ferruginibacter sp.]
MKKGLRHNFFLLIGCLVIAGSHLFAQAKPNNVTQGTYKTIYEMLKDVPGLEVKTSNDRNGGSIIVRGTGSLNNQKPPLFVIDGTVYGGDISSINPQDVDAISVLKDAASATAYGAQGAGGVILITTKKGNPFINNAVVTNHTESAYTYFIDHKTKLKVIGLNDEVLVEGVIQKQQDSSLVFIKKKKLILVPVSSIKKVEMIAAD